MHEHSDFSVNPENAELNINLSLLRRLAETVRLDPESFDMGEWVRSTRGREAVAKAAEHPCFTEACIAGWTVFLDRGSLMDIGPWQIATEAQRLLGITENQAARLFYAGHYTPQEEWSDEYWTQEDEDDYAEMHWPRKFSTEYRWRPKSREDHIHNAQVASDRINHFINTLGAE